MQSYSSRCSDTLTEGGDLPEIRGDGGHQCIIGGDKNAINSTPPHYHPSLLPNTKVSPRDESPNQCVSITGRNWSPRDLCGWVMWNPSQVSPRGPDKIKDKTPEKKKKKLCIDPSGTGHKREVRVWGECKRWKINHLMFSTNESTYMGVVIASHID